MLLLALLLIQADYCSYRQYRACTGKIVILLLLAVLLVINSRTACTGSNSKGKVQVLVKAKSVLLLLQADRQAGSISAYKGSVLAHVKANQCYCSYWKQHSLIYSIVC